MSKVSCFHCARPFAVLGIVRRGESCFCSTVCLVDSLEAKPDTRNAVSVEYHVKEPDPVPFNHQAFRAPGLLGLVEG